MSRKAPSYGTDTSARQEAFYLRAGNIDDLQTGINELLAKDARWRLVSVYHDRFYHTAWLEFRA